MVINQSPLKCLNRVIDIRKTKLYLNVFNRLKTEFGWSKQECDRGSVNFVLSMLVDNMGLPYKGRTRRYFLECVDCWRDSGVIDCRMFDVDIMTDLQFDYFRAFILENF